MRRTLAGFFAAFALASPAAAQVDWTFRGPVVPIARIENDMVYDSGNQRMVTFGGYDHNFNRTNDVWEYDAVARTWANVTAPGPTARQGAAMAYDPLRARILMCGGIGDGGIGLSDTWEWDTAAKTWTELSPATSPSPRGGARLVYDVGNDRFVLHGGWNPVTGALFSETWAWDPGAGNWTNLNPGVFSPTGQVFGTRTYHGLVYNTSNGLVTLFGGAGGPNGYLNDLWELQGNTWVDVTPPGTKPAPRGW